MISPPPHSLKFCQLRQFEGSPSELKKLQVPFFNSYKDTFLDTGNRQSRRLLPYKKMAKNIGLSRENAFIGR